MTKLRAALLVALATTLATTYVLTHPKSSSDQKSTDLIAPADRGGTSGTQTSPRGPQAKKDGDSKISASISEANDKLAESSRSSSLREEGSAWDHAPEGTSFRAFANWAQRYEAAPVSSRDAMENEGVQLAIERRDALRNLIQTDPKSAISLAVPLADREQLPAAVQAQLETRLSGLGDYTVMAAYPAEAGPSPDFAAVRRTLSLDGVSYQASVYGVREGQPSRSNLPVHGIALDNRAAVSENPVRLLEPGEVKRLSRDSAQEAICGVSAQPATVVNEATPVDVGGQITWICRFAHAEILNSQLQLAASQPGTGFLGDGGVAESPYTEGRKRLLMYRVAFSNLPTPDVTSNQLFAVHAGVDSFWRASSYGKTQLAPIGAGSDIVLITLASPSTAYDGDAGALRTAVRTQATAQGIDLSKYDFDNIYTGSGRPAFDFGGLGYIGAPGAWIVGASASISCHEMGHNLGNPHANFWDTGGATAIGTGDNQEYGDPYDVMGGGSGGAGGNGQYVAKFKWHIGWISDTDFPLTTTGGTFRIYAHDNPRSSGLRGVRMLKTASLEYFLEYRQLYTGNRWMMDGIGLRWGSPSSWSSQLIDTTPGSANGKNDSAIVIGRTFSDTAAGIHITPIGKGHTVPESIDVVVRLGAQVGNQPPVALVSASSTDVAVGAPVTFTATATDPNGDALAYYWEFSDNSSNFSSDNSPVQTVSFGTAGEYTARCIVSDMRGGIAEQSILVRVGTPTTFRIAGHIVDNQNHPVAGALITAAGPATVSTYSDSDGSYVIPGLAAGSYAVAASESIAGSMTFLRPYFTSPVTVGPNFTTADFVGLPGNVSAYTPLVPKISAGWRYNDTGTDQGTAWRATAFSDATWGTGTAPLGYPSGTPITTVVSFGADAANKFPTTYFRKSFTVANPATYTNLLVELLRDDSAVVYLNGVELVRDNLPAGTISYSTLAVANSGADAYIPTTVPASALVAGNNVLAVEVHQVNATSSDIVMDVGLSGLSVSNVTGLKLVYLTQPTFGTRYVTPASIPLQTTVQAGGASATRVDYYADGTKIGESTVAPFITSWNSPSEGTHDITGVATIGGIQYTTPLARVVVGPQPPDLPTVELIAANASWKYLSQASAAAANWATQTFNDSAWPAGPAELGFGDGDEATVVPGGPSTARYPTIYFRRTFVVDDPSAVQSLTALLKRDDGAILYINGVEVARDNMPTGPVTYSTLAFSADDDGATVFSHLLPTTALVNGINTFAAEVHQSSATSSDLTYRLSLSAVLRTNRTRGCWVTAPAPGLLVNLPGTLPLTAEVVAGNGLGISKVEFFSDGLKIGEDTTSPYTFAWVNPPSGNHSILAIATDSQAQPIQSDPVPITVNQPPTGTALVSFGDVWKYRDDGANLGTSWTSRLYDDQTWQYGAAKLGYGVSGLTTTVSYGQDAANRHITTYFRKSFNLASLGGLSSLQLRLVRDDGAVVYLNGLEIYRDNMQSGPVSWNSTAVNTINAPGDSTPIDVLLPLTGLLTGSNVVAVEIHQAATNSSDISFNLALTGLTQTNTSNGLYLTTPAQGAHFNAPSVVTFAAQLAAVPDGTVEFYADGVKVGEDSAAPYEFTWLNAGIGSHVLTARAAFGGVPTDSPSVTISVTTPPPSIIPVYQNLISAGTGWRYFDNASPPTANWNQPSFDDTVWPQGTARFGFGLDGEVTTLTSGRTTHYFRRWFTPTSPVNFTHLVYQLVRDDGAVVYLNGTEVFRSNMPTGPVDATTLAAATVNTPDETTFFQTIVGAAGSGLLSGSNLVAVELHQSSSTSSDAGFDLALVATGTSEPRVYLGSPVQAANISFGHTMPLEAFANAGALDSIQQVEIFVNGASVGSSAVPPYRVDYTFTSFGPQIVSARMTTTLGNIVDATPVSVTVVREALSTQFIAAGSTWKYLDDGSNAGTSANPTWALPAFNDSAWPSGAARLGYGGDGEVTTLRDSRADTSKIITFYFRKSFTVQPGAVYTNLLFNLLRDDGAVVYLNGREVYRTNMPAGTIGYTTLSPVTVSGADEQTFFPTAVAVTNLPVGLNVVGVEIHQQSTTSSDVGFDLSLTASGYAADSTPPRIDVTYRDGLVELSWPATFVGWQIYFSSALGSPWQPLNQAPFVVNGRNVVTVPPANGGQQYYRLGKQ